MKFSVKELENHRNRDKMPLKFVSYRYSDIMIDIDLETIVQELYNQSEDYHHMEFNDFSLHDFDEDNMKILSISFK